MTDRTTTDPPDKEPHIHRLNALRDAGTVNMYTSLHRGLRAMFGAEAGTETYEWVRENFEYYESGDWVSDDE